MTPDNIIVGNHAWFVRKGDSFTLPSPGTVDSDAKPGATDTIWIPMEQITDLTVEPKSEVKPIYAPTPGQLRLVGKKETKRELTVTFTIQKLSAFMFELMFKTGPLTGSGPEQYNPLEGATTYGWLKVQQYDDNDVLLNTFDGWSVLMVSGGVSFGDDIVQPTIQADILHSPLNTGQLE